nr:hypothetical protein [uncultured Mucilaginibacter sp.]
MIKNLGALIVSFTLATTGLSLGQTPVKQNLAGIATIDFPAAAEEGDVPNGLGKIFKLVQSTQTYTAITIHIDTAQVVIKTSSDLDLFYSGVVEGAADSTQHRKRIYTKQIMAGKYKAVEFKYLDESTAKKFTAYQRIVYLEATLFIYSFNVYDDQPAIATERERFLNSFTVTKTTARQL